MLDSEKPDRIEEAKKRRKGTIISLISPQEPLIVCREALCASWNLISIEFDLLIWITTKQRFFLNYFETDYYT